MTAITAVETQAIQKTITQAAADALQFGQPVGGGFFAGKIRKADGVHVLVSAPKDGGERLRVAWHTSDDNIVGATSFFDGRANTLAMAEAGSELAKWAIDLQLNGLDDWHVPARDEAELLHRNLKPSAGNIASFRDGENPSSVPAGYPYTEDSPTQTAAEAFQAGGPEAFEEGYYFTSTQNAEYPSYAWVQGFGSGYQYVNRKGYRFHARVVRSMLIIQ
ncbi:DUF1566 domain-containing protein [Cupriavidus sp. WS]|uniref:Lcl domain-containing protein n=1 Tax=Cupriavidus sp. WS TaxID=1312922 RepID=UPI000372A762|nr:DUF1566 domain-containing protein [Cupriavidus sp. WS]